MATIADIDPKNPNKIKGVDWGLVPIPSSYAELYKNYGDPRKDNFEEDYLINLPHTLSNGQLIHVKAHIAMTTALHDIFGNYNKYINDCGGSYNFRDVRGTENTAHPKLSFHSWGLAIDINVAQNPLGSKDRTKQPPELVAAFKKHGFFWGADYKGRKDPMHFQRCHNF